MSPLVLAANTADADAAQAIARHHTELAATTAVKTLHFLNTVRGERASGARYAARSALVTWCAGHVLPYVEREAEVLYPALPETDEGRMLQAVLERDLALVRDRLADLTTLDDPHEAGAAAVMLRSAIEHHLQRERDELLPYLAFARSQSIAALWQRLEPATSAGLAADSAASAASPVDAGLPR
ncbi:hypothetical protein OSC27_02525 [Microbacterium sp. STN6]|uniref:hemerythrin domain-containing protein n=1 Tax=Microbacterium sp. STN6 TaxID=2995588 RepID=UPI002260EC32|nr:hemerythrin domain-containing protein [Microbacterium sp. STN6]MCX7521150.1 hypothetical protein [Microbacterium sp. STN6]